jgi:hypothetical protein
MTYGDAIAALLFFTVPPLVGASPAFLPARVPASLRWGFALLLLAASLWFHLEMNGAPHPFHLAYLVPFWLGWAWGVSRMLFRRDRRRPR